MVRLAGLVLAALSLQAASGPEWEQARKLYETTEFDRALKILHAMSLKDAAVYDLMGRGHYMLGDYKKATEDLSHACALDPANAVYALWLGRAYGRRAETSSPLTAPGNATKARQWFEKAVELGPRHVEALNDLFEYYLQAPGFLGGGFDKAVGIARRIAVLDAAEGYWAEAKLAEKRKEFSNAEQQLRRAAEAAPQQIGRLIDLARFLARHGRFQESDHSFQRAAGLNPNSPQLLFAQAETYIKSRRNIAQARDLLKRYLASSLTPDDPPRSQAEKLLRQAEGG
jgi:cytochrome c-type biogenesis protein CcmH/NrfG